MLTVPGIPFPLEPHGAPACDADVISDGVVLVAGPKTDIFMAPDGAPGDPVPDAGRMMGLPPEGDFRFSARVSPAFDATFDAGVLFLYAGDRHHAKLCYEFSPARVPMVVSVVTREVSDDCNSFETSGDPVWLRISRVGGTWAFHASLDGSQWQFIRHFALSGTEPARVGLMPQSPTGDGCAVTFDRVMFQHGAPADLRDGS